MERPSSADLVDIHDESERNFRNASDCVCAKLHGHCAKRKRHLTRAESMVPSYRSHRPALAFSCLLLMLLGQFFLTPVGGTDTSPGMGNLMIGRENQLSATSTCGLNGPERFCIVSRLENKTKCFLCDSRRPWARYRNEKSHLVENIVAKRFETRNKKWWQSENGEQNVSIQLDLEAEFHFTQVIITFKSFRPAAMLIERSSDFGVTWRVYGYFAFDCAESFPWASRRIPRSNSDVVCTARYSNVAPSTGGEVVFKVLSPHIPLPDPSLLDYRPEIDETYYYYGVYDMVVRGSCNCYGHAQRCIPVRGNLLGRSRSHRPDMVHGRCECTNNTKGVNCEQCADLYNDLPWRPAIDNETSACRLCECNQHATKCHFDSGVFEDSGKKSGGVCDDCQHHTRGKNCQECEQGYYRDEARPMTDPYACRGAARTDDGSALLIS